MAKDPYKYFRIEAREILEGLTQGVLELEKGASARETVARLFRLAHTLKGASRVVKQPALAEQAHAIEDVLTPHRAGEAPVPREALDAILRINDAIAAALAALEPAPVQAGSVPAPPLVARVPLPAVPPPPQAPAAPRPSTRPVAPVETPRAAPEERFETVRVDLREMDALLDGIFETGVQVTSLRNGVEELDHARQQVAALLTHLAALRTDGPGRDRPRAMAEDLRASLERLRGELVAGLDHAEAGVRDVRERAGNLRLLPASGVFQPLERAARDAAQSLGRRMDFVATGGDIRLDGHVLLAVRDALLHVVRNAVAHGIEAETDRVAAGKAPVGRVHLRVERRGNRVAFACDDDGRGIDVAAVRRAAVARGALRPEAVAGLDDHAAMQLVFLPGMSTTTQVTEVSGRGVGLDVVRAAALRFKGDFEAHSQPGRGASVEISVPVSLASLTALEVEVAGARVSIPLDAVSCTLRVAPERIARVGGRLSVIHDGVAVPYLSLAAVVAPGVAESDRPGARSVVVLRAAGHVAAVGVDRLCGTTEVVVRRLPSLVGALPCVSGASLDSRGDPHLVLDPVGLVEVARSGGAAESVPARGPRPPILVIDDSLTTRMLEQSILESAGYEVDLASSGEEGLAMAAARRYGLFICDVEMPGMNGFEFVARTRQDPALRAIPAIQVTSLNTPSDRRRSAEAGAAGYIVKGEFDQNHLLQLIRELMG